MNAWLHLARTHAIDDDLDESYRCLDRAKEIDAEETAYVDQVRTLIDTLKDRL